MGARPNVPVPDKEGMSPLAYAASAEQIFEMTQVLLDGGADPHYVDKSGRTPLSYAAMYSNLGMAQMLIHQGANPSHIDEEGVNPLAYAASAIFKPTETESNVKLAQMLIDLGADPNDIDAHGKTTLTRAILNGNSEVAKVLIDGGVDPTSHAYYSYTPLAWARKIRNSPFIELSTKEAAEVDHAGTPKWASSVAAAEDSPLAMLD